MKNNKAEVAHPMIPMEGILLVDKEISFSSFQLIRILRKSLSIQKIGHTGTLDPFATGLMVLLIGKKYTKLSDTFIGLSKVYTTTLVLGKTTSTYDREGEILSSSDFVPSREQIDKAIDHFQGEILQTPPMYSAKKVAGKKLYTLARKGIEIPRKAEKVSLAISSITYDYPYLFFRVLCSKGTYIRSLAHDLGQHLGCGAYVQDLRRESVGNFSLEKALPQKHLNSKEEIARRLICHETSQF